ncbi:MAG: hypothetical protein V4760_18450 [Bdellovibrionota bacterium]
MNLRNTLALAAIAFSTVAFSTSAWADTAVVTKLDDGKSNEVYDLFDKNLEKSDKGTVDIEEIILAKKNKITGAEDNTANIIYKKKIGAMVTLKEKKLSAYDTEKLKTILAVYSKKEENRLAKIYKLEGVKCVKGVKIDCSVIEK